MGKPLCGFKEGVAAIQTFLKLAFFNAQSRTVASASPGITECKFSGPAGHLVKLSLMPNKQ